MLPNLIIFCTSLKPVTLALRQKYVSTVLNTGASQPLIASKSVQLKLSSAKHFHEQNTCTTNSKTQKGNSVDPDEVAQYEPPHLDLPCLRI